MASRMDYISIGLRSCIPFAGIAIIGNLYGDRNFFWDLLLLPFAVVLPLISWITIKILRETDAGHVIPFKYFFIYVFSLIFLAVVVLFSFVAEGAGSHGGYNGPLFIKYLFAVTIIVIIPSVELVLYLNSKIMTDEKKNSIKLKTIVTRIVFVVFIICSFLIIIWPPVNMALRQNYRNIAMVLINLRFDVNQKDGWGCSPLWYAINRCDPEIAATLLSRGAIVDKQQSYWGLLRSIEVNNIEMLRLLITHEANVCSADIGSTALAYACQFKRTDIIRILLDNGADINFRSTSSDRPYPGKSALEVAYEIGDVQLVELLLSGAKK